MLERANDLRYDVKITCWDMLIPSGHLLRKIERTIDFSKLYGMAEHLYGKDNGSLAVAPVVLVKMGLLQAVRDLNPAADGARSGHEYHLPLIYRF